VQDQDRNAPPAGPALVDEVDRLAVDLGGELRKSVQLALDCAPVEGLGPVFDDRAQRGDLDAVVSACARDRVRPAREAQAGLEIRENVVGDGDSEGLRGHGVTLSERGAGKHGGEGGAGDEVTAGHGRVSGGTTPGYALSPP
jgi:hypothetical protein